MLAFFAAVAVTMSVSDIGGYGLAMLMGIPSMWSIKMAVSYTHLDVYKRQLPDR